MQVLCKAIINMMGRASIIARSTGLPEKTMHYDPIMLGAFIAMLITAWLESRK